MSAPRTPSPGVPPRHPAVAIAASVAIHFALAAALAGVGITAARAMRREAPPVLVADWTPPPPARVAPAAPDLPVPGGAPLHVGPAARARTDPALAGRNAADRLARNIPAAAAGGATMRLGGPLGIGGELPPAFRSAGFAAGRERVAFVVDAGGRLLSALPAARTVLAQRLAMLTPDQRFTVAVVRGTGVEFAPGTPAEATREATAAALRWFTERASPGGTGNLCEALERCWERFGPDAVCVIARGSPKPRRAAARTATEGVEPCVERLDPPGQDGRRPASFLCIELLDPSADGALRRVAERCGGPTGYLLLDRAALGIAPSRPATPRQ